MNRLKKIAADNEIRTYEIEATPNMLNRLEEIFGIIQFLGKAGASREVSFYVDGDGAARVKFKVDGKEIESTKVDTDKDIIKGPGLC